MVKKLENAIEQLSDLICSEVEMDFNFRFLINTDSSSGIMNLLRLAPGT